MLWTKSLLSLALFASIPRLGHARAVPSDSCTLNGEGCEFTARGDFRPYTLHSGTILPLDQSQNHDFDDLVTHWKRHRYQPFSKPEIRAVPFRVPDEPEPVAPVDPTTPDGSSTDPSDNSSAGLDPTAPDSPTTDPSDNSSAGLDPTAPDSPTTDPSDSPPADSDPTTPDSSTTDPSDSPPADSDPTDSTPDYSDPVIDNSFVTDPQPATEPESAGCGLKRADQPCLGPSDNIGDDVPGQTPDAVAPSRADRPVDDEHVAYDYLAEVRRERGTGLTNDKLANLEGRIANHVPDDEVRVEEINSKFTYDSEKPPQSENSDPFAKVFNFDSILSDEMDHADFIDSFPESGIKLSDASGRRQALRSTGAAAATLKWSWSGDQKVAFTDWSYKKNDLSDMSPKAHYSELSMALFKKEGVDTTKVEAICQSRIANTATQKTIRSIFQSLKFPFMGGGDVVVLLRSDTDPAKVEAFDAYFRTANGKGTVNLLAYHAEAWGYRSPQSVVLQRAGQDAKNFGSIVTLG